MRMRNPHSELREEATVTSFHLPDRPASSRPVYPLLVSAQSAAQPVTDLAPALEVPSLARVSHRLGPAAAAGGP